MLRNPHYRIALGREGCRVVALGEFADAARLTVATAVNVLARAGLTLGGKVEVGDGMSARFDR